MTAPGDGQPGGGGPKPPYPPSKPGRALDSPADSTDTVLRLAAYLRHAAARNALAPRGGHSYWATELTERTLCQLL